jgi:hypothetical protein
MESGKPEPFQDQTRRLVLRSFFHSPLAVIYDLVRIRTSSIQKESRSDGPLPCNAQVASTKNWDRKGEEKFLVNPHEVGVECLCFLSYLFRRFHHSLRCVVPGL